MTELVPNEKFEPGCPFQKIKLKLVNLFLKNSLFFFNNNVIKFMSQFYNDVNIIKMNTCVEKENKLELNRCLL